MTEIDLTPITRLEYDIDAILNDHAVAEPITRIELILADIVAGNTTTVEPVTRIETYLAIISGADYPVPEPVTRIETFLAIIAGEDYETPEAVTRLEGLLAEWVEKGSGIWKTVTGTLIHLTDALASPMQKLEVALEPIQDLHGQDAPYPAGGGKNKLPNPSLAHLKEINTDGSWTDNKYLLNGVTFTVNGDGTYDASGTANAQADFYVFGTFNSAEEVLPSIGDYTINGSFGSSCLIRVVGFGVSSFNVFLAGASLNATEISGKIILRVPSGVSSGGTFKPMIRLSSVTDATFAPYSNICPITGWTGCEVWVKDEYDTSLPATASVTFPDSAGTVYGGTVDLVSGVLTVTHVSVDMGSLSWNYTGVSASYPYGFFNIAISNPRKEKGVTNIICSTYPVGNLGFSVDKHVQGNGTNNQVYCIDSAYTDKTTFKTAMSGVQLVYELAEPTEISLTPQEISTLKGINNVWSNANGDITLIYKAQAE